MPLAPQTDMLATHSFSPLVLIDRLITLAEQADRAGMDAAAGHLVRLAFSVGDEVPAAGR
jgi:hypothetical protein